MKPPKIFRPLLWYLAWDKVEVDKDKEDIIVNAVNDGTLAHWRWIIRTYGKVKIRAILKKKNSIGIPSGITEASHPMVFSSATSLCTMKFSPQRL